ncbi:hypothetical protein B7494_g3788 [Chlorociboria aeruginascens]|nr:hypothetical protein B7494_g3788 [Chlorociboria aeruginascens]
MAQGTPIPQAQTCRVTPPARETLRLISGHREPTSCTAGEESALDTSSPKGQFLRQDSDYGHVPDIPKNEMLESAAGSRGGTFYRESPPSSPSRDVAHHRSTSHSTSADVPLRQDSAYFSNRGDQVGEDDNSEVDVDIQARQMRAKERLGILRGRAVRTRILIKIQRGIIKPLRDVVLDTQAQLLRKLDEIMALGNTQDLKELIPYHRQLRQAQDELGPAEAAYDRLADRLDDEEYELEEEEDHFYRHNNIDIPSGNESRLDDPMSPLIKPDRPADNEGAPLNVEYPLVQEYLDKVLEAEHLNEELENLEDDYHRLSEEVSFRRRYNIGISQETSTFLADFPKLREDTLENLHAVEDDLFVLRDRCISERLFDESDQVYQYCGALIEDVMASIADVRDRTPLRVAAQHIEYQEHATNFGDKKAYINNWLLQWVQDSSFESSKLRAWIFFEYPLQDTDLDEKWSELALVNWDKDRAGETANESSDANRMDAIAGETGKLEIATTGPLFGSMGNLSNDLDEGAKNEEAVAESETGSYSTARVSIHHRHRRASSI